MVGIQYCSFTLKLGTKNMCKNQKYYLWLSTHHGSCRADIAPISIPKMVIWCLIENFIFLNLSQNLQKLQDLSLSQQMSRWFLRA